MMMKFGKKILFVNGNMGRGKIISLRVDSYCKRELPPPPPPGKYTHCLSYNYKEGPQKEQRNIRSRAVWAWYSAPPPPPPPPQSLSLFPGYTELRGNYMYINITRTLQYELTLFLHGIFASYELRTSMDFKRMTSYRIRICKSEKDYEQD